MASDDHLTRLRELCDQAERLREAADTLCHQIDRQMRCPWNPPWPGQEERRRGERRQGDRRA